MAELDRGRTRRARCGAGQERGASEQLCESQEHTLGKGYASGLNYVVVEGVLPSVQSRLRSKMKISFPRSDPGAQFP